MADLFAPLRRFSARTLVVAAAGVVLTASLLVVVLATMAWGTGLREEQRLLPGTTVAGVDVGGLTVAQAEAATRDQVAADLDREVVLVHDDQRWSTTPRALGASSDVSRIVQTAFDRTASAGLVDLARVRFLGSSAGALDVTLDVPDAPLAQFVRTAAREVDQAPADATLTWTEDGIHVGEATTGRRVVRDAAEAAVRDAIAARSSTPVELPVEAWQPGLTTEAAQDVADEVRTAVDAVLDRPVTLALEDTERTVTPRELGATHNGQALLDAHGATPDDVALAITDDAVHEVVDEVVEPHEVAARDAQLSWTPAGGFASTPGETGLAVDHQEAVARLQDALHGQSDRVDLELHATQPDVTTADFDEVLLVRQGDRQVDLVRNGTTVRTWDVAVGTSGHATPTGMFTIGVKRFEPTWHNSSPDGWGEDMPLEIGPGPHNPLGLRALNWYRDGYDTLIRFHGTANEASIGRAASHGCVRMTNADVIELYDLVDTGIVVVSVDGGYGPPSPAPARAG